MISLEEKFEMIDWYRKGMTISEIARQTGRDRKTVRKAVKGSVPVKQKKKQKHEKQVRQIIETVNGQLADQFQIETNHAHAFWGLCTRLLTKLTAHTLSIYLNRLLERANPLQIKRLAFPN